jgi:hypothetical protein
MFQVAWNALQWTLIGEQNKNLEITKLILTQNLTMKFLIIFLVTTIKIMQISGEGIVWDCEKQAAAQDKIVDTKIRDWSFCNFMSEEYLL